MPRPVKEDRLQVLGPGLRRKGAASATAALPTATGATATGALWCSRTLCAGTLCTGSAPTSALQVLLAYSPELLRAYETRPHSSS